MKRFCVIGLGSFGYHVARTLYESGHEVIAIDLSREKVKRIQEYSSYTIIGDAASKEFLVGQGVAEMDAVVVSTGDRSHLSTLITLYLKEMKVPRILVKAVSEDHGRILEKVGASEVIFPEKDMALKVARGLTSPNILDFLPLSDELSISEAAPPARFVGKSLVEIDLRRRYNVTILGIKDVLTGDFHTLPKSTHVIKDSDILVLVGKAEDIDTACKG
ncbi:potassium channel family protein [Trichloromonas sp.]|uniref:potassium channel family protein n=1 Tax=Trichloromonas sp. TaxID=3069249 RepID=UPI003D813055